jgi:hypothetical protein
MDLKKYLLLHVPRQTGKTSRLLAFMEHHNREGRYRAVYANIGAEPLSPSAQHDIFR